MWILLQNIILFILVLILLAVVVAFFLITVNDEGEIIAVKHFLKEA